MTPFRLRFQGLRDALLERGAADEDIFPLLVPFIGSGPADLSGLDTAMRNLLDSPNAPTAFFFGNNHAALPGLQALLSWGYRIPQDLSVVSFDDTPGIASHTRPALTSMRMPALSLGALAVQTLDQIRAPGETIFRSVHLPAELIIRESTGVVRVIGL